jgi:hypothetical protein
VVSINLDDLNWEALEEIEELVGHPIAAELMAKSPSIRTIRALCLWSLRKTDPGLTLETMPDVGSIDFELAEKGPQVPLASRRRRARSRS